MTDLAKIERITRSLAFMLRHQPEQFDLELDRYGNAYLDDVVRALDERLGEPIDRMDIEAAIGAGGRRRYEIDGDSIRALYGHSIEVDPGESSRPPEGLYLALPGRDVERALRFGLRGGRRRFLHLALTVDDARETGRRLARDYTVLSVRALDAWEEGIDFFDRYSLWLAEEVPTHLIDEEGSFDDGEDPRERMRRDDVRRRPRGRGNDRDRDRGRSRGSRDEGPDRGERGRDSRRGERPRADWGQQDPERAQPERAERKRAERKRAEPERAEPAERAERAERAGRSARSQPEGDAWGRERGERRNRRPDRSGQRDETPERERDQGRNQGRNQGREQDRDQDRAPRHSRTRQERSGERPPRQEKPAARAPQPAKPDPEAEQLEPAAPSGPGFGAGIASKQERSAPKPRKKAPKKAVAKPEPEAEASSPDSSPEPADQARPGGGFGAGI